MANELGPFSAAKKIVVFNPDNPLQVRQVSGSGSPQWTNLSGSTFSEIVTSASQVGTTGIYFANRPSGLDAGRSHQLAIYDSSASATTDAHYYATFVPEARGSGARTVAITVEDGDEQALEGALVRVTSGVTSFSQTSDELGLVTFNLDDATWTVAITLTGYSFAGASLVVDGDEAVDYTLTQNVPTPPAEPNQATGWFYTRDGSGDIEAEATVVFGLVNPNADTDAWRRRNFTVTSNEEGYLESPFIKGATYRMQYGKGEYVTFTVPQDEDTFSLAQVLGEQGTA